LGGVEGARFINKATHQRLRWDTHLISKTIERYIIAPMMGFSFGMWDQLKMPRFHFDTRVIGDLGMMDGLHKAVMMGAEIPADFVNQAFNIPKAEPGQKLLSIKTSEPQAMPSQLQQSKPQPGMAPLQQHNDVDDINKLAGQISSDDKNLDWINDLMDRINQSKSFDDFENIFTEWLREVDISDVEKNLAYSIFLKRIQGMIGDDDELDLV